MRPAVLGVSTNPCKKEACMEALAEAAPQFPLSKVLATHVPTQSPHHQHQSFITLRHSFISLNLALRLCRLNICHSLLDLLSTSQTSGAKQTYFLR